MRRLAIAILTLSFAVFVFAGGAWSQAAHTKGNRPDLNKGYHALGSFIFWRFFGTIVRLDDIERISVWKQQALDALRYRQPKKFHAARKAIKSYTEDVHSESVRGIARAALAELPEGFVPGFAYLQENGAIAADPDPFIRLQLIRDRYAAEGNDSD